MERKPWQFPREGMLHLVRELLVRKTANFDHDDPAERIVELIETGTPKTHAMPVCARFSKGSSSFSTCGICWGRR